MKLQISIDGKAYQLDVEVLEEDRAPQSRGLVPPRAHESVQRTSQQPLAPATPAAPARPEQAVDEARACRSPVAGVVIKIKVNPGQVVKQDDLIMVLEAMKMETNITAPGAGTVKSIMVAEGDGVKPKQLLVEFE
ncbi:MAG: biotin/lipoyl-containing protein [Rhodospirillaceae bacterium]